MKQPRIVQMAVTQPHGVEPLTTVIQKELKETRGHKMFFVHGVLQIASARKMAAL